MYHSHSRVPARYRLIITLPWLLAGLIGLYVLLSWSLPGPLLPQHVWTSPPPDVAIELTDAHLSALTEAYTHGIDPGDPEGGDRGACERLRLLPHKSLGKWRRQFSRRGFTVAKIKDMLRTGTRAPHTHPTKGTTYTKISDPQGNWIIVDFVDCVLWQVAPYNFK